MWQILKHQSVRKGRPGIITRQKKKIFANDKILICLLTLRRRRKRRKKQANIWSMAPACLPACLPVALTLFWWGRKDKYLQNIFSFLSLSIWNLNRRQHHLLFLIFCFANLYSSLSACPLVRSSICLSVVCQIWWGVCACVYQWPCHPFFPNLIHAFSSHAVKAQIKLEVSNSKKNISPNFSKTNNFV